MPQVSRRFLNKKVEERINELFSAALVQCTSSDTALALLEDLLTPTERIMLAKRFSIACMLLKEYNYDIIGDTLKVSRPTIGFVSLLLKHKGDGLRSTITRIKRSESTRELLSRFLDTITEIIATAPGQNWRESKRMLHQSARDRQKAF